MKKTRMVDLEAALKFIARAAQEYGPQSTAQAVAIYAMGRAAEGALAGDWAGLGDAGHAAAFRALRRDFNRSRMK